MRIYRNLFVVFALAALTAAVGFPNAFVAAQDQAEVQPDAAPASKVRMERYHGLTALDDGYVRQWLVLPAVPFAVNPKAATGRAEFLPGEFELRPREGYAFRSEKLPATQVIRWKKYTSTNGVLDCAAMGAAAKTNTFALVYLIAPRPMQVNVAVPTNGPAVGIIRINGQYMTNLTPCDLNEGVNVMMVRIVDPSGGAQTKFRITCRDAKALAELRTTIDPEEQDETRLRSTIEPDPAFVLFPKLETRIRYLDEDMRPRVAEMSKKAIAYLLENQQATGAWSDTHFPDSVGVTALCCLALMSEGDLPKQGPHGKALDKGLEFLLSRFNDDGVCASGKVEGYGVMYGHALATLALLEVNGNLPWRPELEDRIAKALQAILRCQRLDGGWRYELTKTGDSDISVTTTVLWTLGQARRYGYAVPRPAIDQAMNFIDECGENDGMFRYRLQGTTKVLPHSGVGVAALYGAGKVEHRLLTKARALIAHEYQRYSVEDLSSRPYFLFGAFFAGLTMYSSGYEMWQPWYAKMVEVIAYKQGQDGAIADHTDNKVYTTALAAILLQAPNGYLSLFVQ